MSKLNISYDTETKDFVVTINDKSVDGIEGIYLSKYESDDKPYITINFKPIDIGGLKYNSYVSAAQLEDKVIKSEFKDLYLKADRSKIKCLFTKVK